MKRKEFKTTIDAPKEKIWQVLWNDHTYPKWTAPFAEGSRAETDWKEGSQVRFLGPDNCGMISRIKKSDPFDFMSIEHQGVVMNGEEDFKGEEAEKWKGALENYRLRVIDGKTELNIETDIAEEYLESFGKAWPEALQKVKELSEK